MENEFTLLLSASTSEDDRYDTTINIYRNDVQYDGFLALKYSDQTNEELIKFVQQYYPEVTSDCKVIFGI